MSGGFGNWAGRSCLLLLQVSTGQHELCVYGVVFPNSYGSYSQVYMVEIHKIISVVFPGLCVSCPQVYMGRISKFMGRTSRETRCVHMRQQVYNGIGLNFSPLGTEQHERNTYDRCRFYSQTLRIYARPKVYTH